MSKQPYMQVILDGVVMRSVGYATPSPLVAVNLDTSESGTYTNFTATFHIPGDANKENHVTSFEMLLYEFAQMKGAANIPCNIEIGWCEDDEITESLTIQAQFIEFTASVHTGYMEYVLKGWGNFASVAAVYGIAIPAIRGNYRGSEVLEAVLKYIKADNLFDLDIDHDDDVVTFNISASVTSLNEFIYGDGETVGLIQQTYSSGSKSAAYGLHHRYASDDYRRAGMTNTQLRKELSEPITQTQRGTSSYTFSVVEPTFYSKGVIRYKNDTNLVNYTSGDTLIWGGFYTNILSISASYNGVTSQILGSGNAVQTGIAIDLAGTTAVSLANRQNSYAATVESMYTAGNALNNLNALSTQFNTDISVTIVGTPKVFEVAQAVRLVVYTGGTLNPITGVYRILKVAHAVTGTAYTTSLKLQRLDLITANTTVNRLSGYTNPVTIDGKTIGATPEEKLYLGPPCQDIANIMKRGNT